MINYYAEVDRLLSLVADDVYADRIPAARATLERMTGALEEGAEALHEVTQIVRGYRRERDACWTLQGRVLSAHEALQRDDKPAAARRLLESRAACMELIHMAEARPP